MKNEDKCEVTLIPLNRIVTNGNIRKTIDHHGLKQLAKSIESTSLLQPIGVAELDGSKYQIVFGHRRLAAVKLLGWTEIPAIIISGENLPVISILENLQRQDLTTPELALAIKKLLDTSTCNQVELTSKLGKSKSYISRMVKLGKLVEEYSDHVSYTKLPITVYWELLDTPELLIRAEDEKWCQKRARSEAKKLEKLRGKSNDDEGYQDVPVIKSKPISRKLPGCQDLALYNPIRFFDGGFEIVPFTFSSNSSMDIEAVIEKMTELQNSTDFVINLLRQYQAGINGGPLDGYDDNEIQRFQTQQEPQL